MIQTTNDVADFLENNDGTLFIYGIGNLSRWVSDYMIRCEIEWSGYIDRLAKGMDDIFMHGKKVIHPAELSKYKTERLRIIIAADKQDEILSDLQWYARDNDLLCLVPIYKDFFAEGKVLDVNKLLGYFRNKLLTNIPTIITNSCNGGFIYRALGLTALSPTINVGIYPEDFIKICRNPQEYLSEDMVFDHWSLLFGNGKRTPVGRIKDVEVHLAHATNADKAIRSWNTLKKWVKYDNLVFIMSDEAANIPIQIAREFCNLPHKHLLVLQKEMFGTHGMNGVIHVPHNHFHMRHCAMENWFDILGWINGEFEI